MDNDSQILNLNREAMVLINFKTFDSCLSLLNQATQLLASYPDSESKSKLLGITYNNLGCLYKRHHKPKLSLKYLQKAAESEKLAQMDKVSRASTYLNICALYSSINQHENALKNSQIALDLLKNSESEQNYFPTLVIAYHNMAVEQEFLKDYQNSLEFYRLAHETACKNIGKGHPLTISTGSDLQKAEKIISGKEISAIVKEIQNDEDKDLGRFKNRKERLKQKMRVFAEKKENFKALPYISQKYVKVVGKEGRKKERDGEKEVKRVSGSEGLEKGSFMKYRPNSPIFQSFYRKKREIVLPESIRSSKMSSELSGYKSSKNEFLTEGDEALSRVRMSRSLKTKTMMLIQEIEVLKQQFSKGKEFGKKDSATNMNLEKGLMA